MISTATRKLIMSAVVAISISVGAFSAPLLDVIRTGFSIWVAAAEASEGPPSGKTLVSGLTDQHCFKCWQSYLLCLRANGPVDYRLVGISPSNV